MELGAAVLPQTGLSPGEGKGVAVRQALIIPFTEEIRLTKKSNCVASNSCTPKLIPTALVFPCLVISCLDFFAHSICVRFGLQNKISVNKGGNVLREA